MKILIVSDLVKSNYQLVEKTLKNHSIGFADKSNYRNKILNDNYDAIITGDEKYQKELLDHCKNLKIISRCGHGIDNIDYKYATDKGIQVFNTPGCSSDTVAETTIGYMILSLRKFFLLDKMIRENNFVKTKGCKLSETTVGIIGLGSIGTLVAKKLKCFKADTIFYDIDKTKQKNYSYAKYKSLDELFRTSNIVTLHCDLNDTSYHLINNKTISSMKDGVILVNLARGNVVDFNGLKKHIKNGKIGLAIIDVFPDEPYVDEELKSMGNVVLSPHSAGLSNESRDRMVKMCISQIIN